MCWILWHTAVNWFSCRTYCEQCNRWRWVKAIDMRQYKLGIQLIYDSSRECLFCYLVFCLCVVAWFSFYYVILTGPWFSYFIAVLPTPIRFIIYSKSEHFHQFPNSHDRRQLTVIIFSDCDRKCNWHINVTDHYWMISVDWSQNFSLCNSSVSQLFQHIYTRLPSWVITDAVTECYIGYADLGSWQIYCVFLHRFLSWNFGFEFRFAYGFSFLCFVVCRVLVMAYTTSCSLIPRSPDILRVCVCVCVFVCLIFCVIYEPQKTDPLALILLQHHRK
jgi:hypothetical protein